MVNINMNTSYVYEIMKMAPHGLPLKTVHS